MKKNNALLLIPHQDDEINLVGNIMSVISKKWNLYILYSSLDSRKEYSNIRKKEAISACNVWNISHDQIFFLDYPDTPNTQGNHYFMNGNHKIVDDIKNYILKFKPEIIFATDFDFHSDHRMLSLAFEYAMKDILLLNKNYHPIVLKGFCYETAYYGVEDYLASNLSKTAINSDILSNRSFEWNKRISISSNEKNGFIFNKKVFKALNKHKSQYALFHARSIINKDNVFWIRRTDNLVNRGIITVSSGNSDKLHDFLIIDTDDIITLDVKDIDFSKSMWVPNDNNTWIKVVWEKPILLDMIIMHGNPNVSSPEKVHCELYLDDIFCDSIEYLNPYARETIIKFNKKYVKELLLSFKLYSDNFGISELEILNSNDNLIYEIDDVGVSNNINKKLIDYVDLFIFKVIVINLKIKRKIRKLLKLHY